MNEKYNAYVRSVADYFIEEMKKGTAPWQKDWDNAANVVPVSAVTDAPYRGTNALLLMAVRMSQGYGDNRWLTFRQVQELGGKVKKGEHGTKCIFWKHLVEKDEKDEGKTVERLIPCPFVVFNSEQCENLNLKKFETSVHKWLLLFQSSQDRRNQTKSVLLCSGLGQNRSSVENSIQRCRRFLCNGAA